jgi:hypothetical protein
LDAPQQDSLSHDEQARLSASDSLTSHTVPHASAHALAKQARHPQGRTTRSHAPWFEHKYDAVLAPRCVAKQGERHRRCLSGTRRRLQNEIGHVTQRLND